jgi:TATA-box binding protein (TBP) (component of TFIID and TFIIIB)
MSMVSPELLHPDLKISTMTQIGQLSSNIDLNSLFRHLPVKGCIRYMEYGDNPVKGVRSKPKKVSKRSIHPGKPTKRKKYFYNQVTIHLYNEKIINVKVFNNGSVQMTGLKQELQGISTITVLLNEIKKLSEDQQGEIFVDESTPTLVTKKMVMINSDFDIGYKINREILHRSIVEEGYYSSFESSVYPGVNIKYYHNPEKQQDGICNCECMCDGKGKHTCCKKITVAVFKSGSIIITGGQSIQQINTAHRFITEFINTRKKLISFTEPTK